MIAYNNDPLFVPDADGIDNGDGDCIIRNGMAVLPDSVASEFTWRECCHAISALIFGTVVVYFLIWFFTGAFDLLDCAASFVRHAKGG